MNYLYLWLSSIILLFILLLWLCPNKYLELFTDTQRESIYQENAESAYNGYKTNSVQTVHKTPSIYKDISSPHIVYTNPYQDFVQFPDESNDESPHYIYHTYKASTATTTTPTTTPTISPSPESEQ